MSPPQSSGGHLIKHAVSCFRAHGQLLDKAKGRDITYIGIAVLNRVGGKFWLDSTAVYTILVQNLSNAVSNSHVIRVSRDKNMDRCNDRRFCQLPDVQLKQRWTISAGISGSATPDPPHAETKRLQPR